MSIRVLQERCQQLKKIEVVIEKINIEIVEIYYSVENFRDCVQKLGEMNQHLNSQRNSCREAIIFHALRLFGNSHPKV